jgi:hypothetical protein
METAADWFMFALGAGALLDLARETYVGESPNEVIISSALTFNNRYVVHSSSIYYLDGPELPLYAEPAPPVPAKYHPVTVQVVNE